MDCEHWRGFEFNFLGFGHFPQKEMVKIHLFFLPGIGMGWRCWEGGITKGSPGMEFLHIPIPDPLGWV